MVIVECGIFVFAKPQYVSPLWFWYRPNFPSWLFVDTGQDSVCARVKENVLQSISGGALEDCLRKTKTKRWITNHVKATFEETLSRQYKLHFDLLWSVTPTITLCSRWSWQNYDHCTVLDTHNVFDAKRWIHEDRQRRSPTTTSRSTARCIIMSLPKYSPIIVHFTLRAFDKSKCQPEIAFLANAASLLIFRLWCAIWQNAPHTSVYIHRYRLFANERDRQDLTNHSSRASSKSTPTPVVLVRVWEARPRYSTWCCLLADSFCTGVGVEGGGGVGIHPTVMKSMYFIASSTTPNRSLPLQLGSCCNNWCAKLFWHASYQTATSQQKLLTKTQTTAVNHENYENPMPGHEPINCHHITDTKVMGNQISRYRTQKTK